jgi:hypothetical protein
MDILSKFASGKCASWSVPQKTFGLGPVDRGLVWLDPLGLHADLRHPRNHLAHPAADVKIPASSDNQRVVEPVAVPFLGDCQVWGERGFTQQATVCKLSGAR